MRGADLKTLYEITLPCCHSLKGNSPRARASAVSAISVPRDQLMLGDGVSTNASTTKPAAVATLCQRVVVRSPRLPMSARSVPVATLR